MKPRIGLDRVELRAPLPPERRMFVATLFGLGFAVIVVAFIFGIAADRSLGASAVTGPKIAQLEHDLEKLDVSSKPELREEPQVPADLDAWATLRKDSLYTLIIRGVPAADLEMVILPNDADFLDAMDGLTAQMAWVEPARLPDQRLTSPTRGVLAERDAWFAGGYERVNDAIHELTYVEVRRARSLGWSPTISEEALLAGRTQMQQWDWHPRARPPVSAPSVFERPPTGWSVVGPATGIGLLVALGLWLLAGLALRRPFVLLSREGLFVDGRRVPTAQISSVERDRDGLHLVFTDGRTLDLPSLGHVLASRVTEALKDPCPAPAVSEPRTLIQLRRASSKQ